jgi:hypothetical protein
MAGTHQILPQRLTGTHQIPRGLLPDARYLDRMQRSGHQQPHQQLRVALIGLDPIGRRARRLARRDHNRLDPCRERRACQPEARRARLVDRAHRRSLRGKQTHDLLDPATEPAASQLARLRIDKRDVHTARVDVETDPCHRLCHPAGPSSGCGQPQPISGQTNPRTPQ